MGEPFTTAYTRIEARPTGLSKTDAVLTPATPPRLVLSAEPKEGGCGGMIARASVLGR
jgi:hypothetical protein